MLPSQVSNREPGVYTAQEKTKGVHLAPEARRKRAASKAFEHVINVRTDYGRFRTRMFHACGVTCAFARKRHLYNHMKKQYALATGRSEEVVDKHYFVGKDRFYQYLKVIGKYKVIRAAVAERVGPLYDGTAWKLSFHNPQKKRDFKICGTCSALAETRFGAVATANAALFHQQSVYMDVHTLVVAARRNNFMANQRLAMALPNEHLTMIFDAMAHNAP